MHPKHILTAGRAVVEMTVERPDGSLAFVPADGSGPSASARLQLVRPPTSWVPPCRDRQLPASVRLQLAHSQAGCLAGYVRSGVGHPFRAAHKLRAGSLEEQLLMQHFVVRVPRPFV